MRYSKNEDSVLIGRFGPNEQVKIRVLALDTDNELILDTNECIESGHIPGVYMWSTRNINYSNVIDQHANLMYLMTSLTTSKEIVGKFTYGGYVDDQFDNIKNSINDILVRLDKLDVIDTKLNTLDIVVNKLNDIITLLNKLDDVDEKVALSHIQATQEFSDVKTLLNSLLP